MRNTPRRHRRWPLRARWVPASARTPASMPTEDRPVAADPIQLAIGLLTASLDSPELEAWAAWALIPEDPAALGDIIAGLHLVSLVLLHRLQEATGQPPAATLQELAITAANGPGQPFAA